MYVFCHELASTSAELVQAFARALPLVGRRSDVRRETVLVQALGLLALNCAGLAAVERIDALAALLGFGEGPDADDDDVVVAPPLAGLTLDLACAVVGRLAVERDCPVAARLRPALLRARLVASLLDALLNLGEAVDDARRCVVRFTAQLALFAPRNVGAPAAELARLTAVTNALGRPPELVEAWHLCVPRLLNAGGDAPGVYGAATAALCLDTMCSLGAHVRTSVSCHLLATHWLRAHPALVCAPASLDKLARFAQASGPGHAGAAEGPTALLLVREVCNLLAHVGEAFPDGRAAVRASAFPALVLRWAEALGEAEDDREDARLVLPYTRTTLAAVLAPLFVDWGSPLGEGLAHLLAASGTEVCQVHTAGWLELFVIMWLLYERLQPAVTARAFAALPALRFRPTTCAVCQRAVESGDELIQLPACAHAVHTPCLWTWSRARNACPECAQPIVDGK